MCALKYLLLHFKSVLILACVQVEAVQSITKDVMRLGFRALVPGTQVHSLVIL